MDNAAALMFCGILRTLKGSMRISDIRLEMMCCARLQVCFGMLRLVKGDVLRYSGDDFVTVFFEVTEEELSEIQKEMCRRVEALRFPELPGVQLKLVTAGTSIPGRVEEMLEQVRI